MNKREILVYMFVVFFLVNHTIAITQDLPNGWEGFTNSASSHCIILPKNVYPVVNNAIIDEGDFVGVFFNENGILKCGGAAKYIYNENISIFAYGNDPFVQGKNGFYNYDSIYWKIYSNKLASEIDINFIKYKLNDNYNHSGIFTNFAISVVDCISAGNFSANAFISQMELCEYENVVLLNCCPQGGSGDYSYCWKSFPGGVNSFHKSFECSINEDTFFELIVTDNLTLQKRYAYGFTSVSYISPPEIIINNDTSLCMYEAHVELNPEINNYSTICWYTNGDGYFENYNNSETKYYYGNYDIMLKNVELTIEAHTSFPCYYSSFAIIRINLDDKKRISAGKDIAVMSGETVELNAHISCFVDGYEINWQPDSLLFEPHALNPITLPLFSDVCFVLSVTDYSTYLTYSDTVNVTITDSNGTNAFFDKINIYPNPISERLYIENVENVAVRIYDIYGRLIFKDELISGNNYINTSFIRSGVCYLKITRGKDCNILKLIKL
ncbi:T9SS type A sorting domain-containing protein [Bacteroidales bacterium OttesenSCG-928-K03]|nr:T9SS type A sorting domain-containing protein [Bacteroidales bacterium OttesenSCG-928-L14]MDL2240351.1 T9SS type A sorting domain-containing protein [Bacteroidales bacterium OttesenSCG-928-K22]MDL2242504.1 T9SS type A sorting domain-containing protein [Bacteroidales bacterium OttesenSCG-928-K03]